MKSKENGGTKGNPSTPKIYSYSSMLGMSLCQRHQMTMVTQSPEALQTSKSSYFTRIGGISGPDGVSNSRADLPEDREAHHKEIKVCHFLCLPLLSTLIRLPSKYSHSGINPRIQESIWNLCSFSSSPDSKLPCRQWDLQGKWMDKRLPKWTQFKRHFFLRGGFPSHQWNCWTPHQRYPGLRPHYAYPRCPSMEITYHH